MMCQSNMMFMHHACFYEVKDIWLPILGKLSHLIGTLIGSLGKYKKDKCNCILLVLMLSLSKSNQSVSVCMLNSLGCWQD